MRRGAAVCGVGVAGVGVVVLGVVLAAWQPSLLTPATVSASQHQDCPSATATTTSSHSWEACSQQQRHHQGEEVDTVGQETWTKPKGSDFFGTAGDAIIEEMKAENMEEYLRYLTSQGHMAGTKQDLEQAEHLKEVWEEQGLDQVFLQPYEVQLSHPDLAKPNKVYLLDEAGQVKFTSSVMEEPVDGVPYDDSIPPAFLAFAPAGTVVTDELVYVNYAQYEDFLEAARAGVSVEGRLVIAKFGRGFRGDKVHNAQRFKAAGIILYTRGPPPA